MARAAESSVPSPPSTIIRSQPSGTSSRGRPPPAAYSAVCSSRRTCTLRPPSHSRSLGTMDAAAAEFGLEQIPTVSMMGIEQKLPISLGAGDGALDHLRLKSEFMHGLGHPLAGGPVEFRLAHDAALSHLALTNFKLRFD